MSRTHGEEAAMRNRLTIRAKNDERKSVSEDEFEKATYEAAKAAKEQVGSTIRAEVST